MSTVTETATIASKIIHSEDGTHLYQISRVWDEAKEQIMLISLCAGQSDTITTDVTGQLVTNNLKALDYGGFSLCNLYSTPDKQTDDENTRIILSEAMKATKILLSWGTGVASNLKIQSRIAEIMELLRPYRKQTYCITALNGKCGQHPLSPSLRRSWIISPFEWPDEAAPKEKAKIPPQRAEKKAVLPA